jgi:hypothetical protein
VFAVEGAPHRLAVDRDLPRRVLVGAEDRSHPAQKAALERLGSTSISTRRNVSCEGMPFGSSRKPCSHGSLAAAVEGDVLEALGLAEDGADRDHQDVDEPMLDLPPAARVLDGLQLGDQGFEHGLPLRRERPSP